MRNLAATVQAGPDLVASEGGLISILASFADPGLLDTHTATVNWGDGTATQSIAVRESGGAGTVFASHSYADDGLYVVTVTVTDDEGATGADTLTATVGNLAPRVQAGPDRTVDAGQLLVLPYLYTTEQFVAGFDTLTFQALAGSFMDPGALDRHTATIDWGDGTIENVSVNERTFSPQSLPARTVGFVAGTHRYETSGTFNVLITVTDNAGDAGFDSFTVVVNPPTQVAPILSIAGDSTTSEGALYLLTLSASGPGSDTVLGWTINWGDGTIETVVGNPPGVTHTYRDGPQTFTISASATTAAGTFNTSALSVDVNNVAPSELNISIASTTTSVGGTVSLTGTFSEPGTLDTHTVLINWGDGKTDQVQLDANVLSFSQLSPSYLATGSFQGSVRVLDKDGDLSESQLFVINVGGSIHVLNPSFCGALTLSGNASININGPVIVNSSCASKAIAASGNSRIVASRVDVVGGVQLTGNSRISSSLHTGSSPSTDPFAAMGAPVGGVTRGSFSCSGKSKQTISPGVYTKITVSANCELTMQPGEYVIKGNGLSVTGNARVIGAGIMIYNAGSNFPNASGTFGRIVISGNGAVELTPPSSGPYHGVTIFQARGNSRQFDLAGNAAGIKGVIYAPAARVNLTGNGQLGMTLFVDRLDLNGNAAITLTAADEPPISEPNAVLPSSAASRRIDLLTVIMHELGHFLGREDVFAASSNELMSAFLPTGMRRLPVAESGITFSPLDVNRDGVISPLDALLVINALNIAGTRQAVSGSPLAAFDVNADGFVSPLDVMVIINSLNAPTSSLLGEGEPPVDATINRPGPSQRLAYLADRRPLTSPDATRVLAAETRRSPTRRDDVAWRKFSPCHPGTQEDLLDALAVEDRLVDHVESAVDLWFRQLGE